MNINVHLHTVSLDFPSFLVCRLLFCSSGYIPVMLLCIISEFAFIVWYYVVVKLLDRKCPGYGVLFSVAFLLCFPSVLCYVDVISSDSDEGMNERIMCIISARCVCRTNRRAMAMMFVCPSVWDGRTL